MNKTDKLNFLRNVNLAKVNFTAQIADFGLSTIYIPSKKGH